MDDNASWLAFKSQLQSHYEALEMYHRELGGEYQDSSTSLMDVLQAALQASLEATKAECDRVREDCESMLRDMSRMRIAMGETLISTGTHDPFSDREPHTRIKAPLLDSRKVLRIEHSATRKSFEDRASKVAALYRRIAEYAAMIPQTCIGIESPIIDAENPPEDVSLTKLGQLDSVAAFCSQEVTRRKKQVQAYGRDIVQLWAELAIETRSINSEHDRSILLDAQDKPEVLGLMDDDLMILQDKRESLIAEKTLRKNKIESLIRSISNLHHKLHLPEADLKAFTLRIRGFAMTMIKTCEEELDRLNDLKKDHIQDFVQDARISIHQLWDNLYYSEDDRLAFTPAFTEIFTDASLQAHENEIVQLHAKVDELQPLLSLLTKHMALEQEKKDLEIQVSDSSRFSKRGYNPMAESKLRARIENTMPKIHTALREALDVYEQKYYVPFRVWGDTYLDTPLPSRKPISRLEPGQSYGNRANPLPERPSTTNSTKSKPRTPSTLTRPASSRGAVNALGRSISTPIHSALSTSRGSSQSPTKRTASHHISASVSRSAVLRERTDQNNTTKLPTRALSSKSRSNSVSTTPRKPPPQPATQRTMTFTSIRNQNRMPPPQGLRVAMPTDTGLTGSSTSSQLSTENWDAVQASSEEGSVEDDVVKTDRNTAHSSPVYDRIKTTELLERHRFDPSSSMNSGVGLLESPLQEVPEEGSFIDDWGEEGF